MQHPSMVASTVVIGTVAVSAAALVGLGVVPGQQSVDANGDYRVVRVIDGESLYVQNADGEQFRVRLIGIDAADRGTCGYGAASEHLAAILAPGEVVQLSASVGKVDSPDHSGRFLRFVLDGDDGDGAADVGTAMINDGYAVARYDSRDGFGAHEKESLYRRLDESSMPADGCATVTAGQAGQAGQGAASTSQAATREPSQSIAARATTDSGASGSSPTADAGAPAAGGVRERVDRSAPAATPFPGGAPIPEPFPTAATRPAPIPEPSAIRSIPKDDPAPAPSRTPASANPTPVVPTTRTPAPKPKPKPTTHTSAPTPARTPGPTSSGAASPTEKSASPTATPTNRTSSPTKDDTKRSLLTKETKGKKWPWRASRWSDEEREDDDEAHGRADRDD